MGQNKSLFISLWILWVRDLGRTCLGDSFIVHGVNQGPWWSSAGRWAGWSESSMTVTPWQGWRPLGRLENWAHHGLLTRVPTCVLSSMTGNWTFYMATSFPQSKDSRLGILGHLRLGGSLKSPTTISAVFSWSVKSPFKAQT